MAKTITQKKREEEKKKKRNHQNLKPWLWVSQYCCFSHSNSDGDFFIFVSIDASSNKFNSRILFNSAFNVILVSFTGSNFHVKNFLVLKKA